jgi:hypothetical protein
VRPIVDFLAAKVPEIQPHWFRSGRPSSLSFKIQATALWRIELNKIKGLPE